MYIVTTGNGTYMATKYHLVNDFLPKIREDLGEIANKILDTIGLMLFL